MITKKIPVRRSAAVPQNTFRGSTVLLSDEQVIRHIAADFIVSDIRAGKVESRVLVTPARDTPIRMLQLKENPRQT